MDGYSHAQMLLAARLDASGARAGTVFKKTIGHYTVDVDGHMIVCSISSRLRKVLVYPIADPASRHPRVQDVEEARVADPVALGDIVRLVDAGDGTAMITEVLERKNALVRRAAGSKLMEQVIVANVDQVICTIAAARPAPELDLLDRYLVAAAAAGLPALICITKADLADRAALAEVAQIYRRLGYRVLLTSAETGSGITEVRTTLAGCVSVLAGQSGVGKTTLLNSVQPELGLRVRDVSRKSGTGRHTTSHLEMFGLAGGGAVADTPGMREYEPWNMRGARLDALFPEMEPLIGQCHFGMDCSHTHERGCAVKQAVATNEIAQSRYRSYARLYKTPPDPRRRQRKNTREYQTASRRQLVLDEGVGEE